MAGVKNEELIKLDEDMAYMVIGLDKLKQRLKATSSRLRWPACLIL